MGEPARPTEAITASEVRTSAEDFEMYAEQAPQSLIAEFADFLRHNKKWWLTPIVVVLLLVGLFALLLGTPVAPFLYTLF
jgi:hypothetical protein